MFGSREQEPASQGAQGAPPQRENVKSAMPPSCPRCELTKTQFSRTIQNYQKAFRKKVEGMKVELKSVRNTNEALRRQVKRLKGPTRYLPGLAIGIIVGSVGSGLLRRLLQRRRKQPVSDEQQQEEQQQQEQQQPPPESSQ